MHWLSNTPCRSIGSWRAAEIMSEEGLGRVSGRPRREERFVRDCQALSADLWTCGMELRPTYGSAVLDPAVHDRLEDAERRISEAARGIADIARAMVGGHGP